MTILLWACLVLSSHASFSNAHSVNVSNIEIKTSSKAPGHYGYYEVRKGAHTFWWRFPMRGRPEAVADKTPLILWLQGGPGASGTGYGNFMEIGPYSVGWHERPHTWAQFADLLFVDNPVGTGFSYVSADNAFAKDNKMVADDLLSFLRQYLSEHAAHDQPLYIFSESYGGKMCTGFAERILEEKEAGRLEVNLRGIALGDSWISALDYVKTWGEFLKAWSLLDDYQLSQLAPLQLDIQLGNYVHATELWGVIEGQIGKLTDNVDWYNALLHNIPDTEASAWMREAVNNTAKSPAADAGLRVLARHHSDPLTDFMRGDATKRLGIIPENVTWGGQSGQVFESLAGDFMKDSIASVDAVLDQGLSVTLYNGQLDLICSTLGLDAWIPKLKWSGLPQFQAASPKPLYAASKKGNRTSGFVRKHDNLALFIILNAGHMIPADQPEAALDLVRRIVHPLSESTF